jgi:hypothetical protein
MTRGKELISAVAIVLTNFTTSTTTLTSNSNRVQCIFKNSCPVLPNHGIKHCSKFKVMALFAFDRCFQEFCILFFIFRMMVNSTSLIWRPKVGFVLQLYLTSGCTTPTFGSRTFRPVTFRPATFRPVA